MSIEALIQENTAAIKALTDAIATLTPANSTQALATVSAAVTDKALKTKTPAPKPEPGAETPKVEPAVETPKVEPAVETPKVEPAVETQQTETTTPVSEAAPVSYDELKALTIQAVAKKGHAAAAAVISSFNGAKHMQDIPVERYADVKAAMLELIA